MTPWSGALLEKLIVAHLVNNIPPYTGPEILSPCSQKPATSRYPGPDGSSARPQTLLILHPF